ncbi:MAG TPA: sigma-54 dependent transcriptional regulator [Spirochaetia bacterium]|nr:sigma-54 dependent transcriptional regulator [Spirochaetia bacterium]
MSAGRLPENPILIVDDERAVADGFDLVLKSNGINHVQVCTDSREVMGILRAREFELVLLDLAMPHLAGEALLGAIREEMPNVPVVIVTGRNDVKAAVECMKAGAFDYLVKAVEESRLVSSVRRAMELRALSRDYRRLKERMLAPRLAHPQAFERIVTGNQLMHSLFRIVEAVARSSEPILITGETGTGKGLFAAAVHAASNREGPFVEVNVAGVEDTMFSDTLFGRRKGAFTSAVEARGGLVQQAGAGTMFLDEIGDLSIPSQVKLLRLLDTGEYYPLGSDLPRRTAARFVVATNRDLASLMSEGTFRRDLFYRLSTHELRLPPLRERRDDIPLLLDHFLEEACAKLGKPRPSVPRRLLDFLAAQSFPGNVRELRSLVIDAVSRQSSPVLALADLVPGSREKAARGLPGSGQSPLSFPDVLPTLGQVRELLIDEALKRSGGNQSLAATMLGLSHQALSKRLAKRKLRT